MLLLIVVAAIAIGTGLALRFGLDNSNHTPVDFIPPTNRSKYSLLHDSSLKDTISFNGEWYSSKRFPEIFDRQQKLVPQASGQLQRLSMSPQILKTIRQCILSI